MCFEMAIGSSLPQNWIVEVEFDSNNDQSLYKYGVCAQKDSASINGLTNGKASMICNGETDAPGNLEF